MTINWNEIWEKIAGDTSTFIVKVLGIIIILLIARLALGIVTKNTTRGIEKGKAMQDERKGKELVTAMTIIRSVSRYLIYFIACC